MSLWQENNQVSKQKSAKVLKKSYKDKTVNQALPILSAIRPLNEIGFMM